MTEAQRELILVIRAFVKEHGYAPTVREIAELMGIGHGTAQRLLQNLADSGKIEKRERVARGYRIRGL
jgi:SOS-response transcriptional repressor LexA